MNYSGFRRPSQAGPSGAPSRAREARRATGTPPRGYGSSVAASRGTADTGRCAASLPATALGWVHALLAILLKYREVVGLGEVAGELVATARRLRELNALLTDGSRARVVAVTRAAELPLRETERLLARLARLRLAVPAVVVDALGGEGCVRCANARRIERRLVAGLACQRATGRRRWSIISTPAAAPPPRGVAGLVGWARTWELE